MSDSKYLILNIMSPFFDLKYMIRDLKLAITEFKPVIHDLNTVIHVAINLISCRHLNSGI